MDDFKQLTEQLLKFYIDTESVDDIGFENFFDDNSSIIGTGKHEFFRNLHEFQESYKFDVKQRGKIRLKIRDLQQEEAELGDDQILAYGSVVFTGLFEDGSVCFEMDTIARAGTVLQHLTVNIANGVNRDLRRRQVGLSDIEVEYMGAPLLGCICQRSQLSDRRCGHLHSANRNCWHEFFYIILSFKSQM